MKSPITGKEMILTTEITVLPFRKEEFKVVYHYYLCEESGEQFTDDKLDNLNQSQVYNQYREKHGIPFPEQIIAIRDKYNVSANKMSEILGFGPNTYRLYESGEMPSVANGRLILGLEQPEEFIRQVKESSKILKEKEYERILEHAKTIEEKEKANFNNRFLEEKVFYKSFPMEVTGYKKPDYQKVYAVIDFFGKQMELYKTKLNKLLFYSDFAMYREYGISITGNTYRAISYGPVPTEFEMLFSKLQKDGLIEAVYEPFINGNYAEKYQPIFDVKESRLTDSELIILDNVANKFKALSSTDLVNLSHKELGWIENKEAKNVISYQQFAFLLKGL